MSSKSTLKLRTPGVATRSGNAATVATGAAGECASAIGSRRATEVRDQCRNFVLRLANEQAFCDVSVQRRALEILQGKDLSGAGRRDF